MVSAMSKLHSKAAADELEEMPSAGWIAAGIPPTALENPILKKALELVASAPPLALRLWSGPGYPSLGVPPY